MPPKTSKKRKHGCMSLEEAAEDLARRQAEVRRRLKNARSRQLYHERLQTATSVSSFLRTVLVLLYVFGGYRVELAQSYWAWQRKRKKLVPLEPSLTKRQIVDFFLEVPDEHLPSLLNPDVTDQKSAWRRACSWQNKVKLATWVRTCNVAKGLAPSSRMLINEYNRLRNDTPFLIKAEHHGDPATVSSTRVMVHRWRRAVQGKWKSIRILEYVSLEDKRNKATAAHSPFPKTVTLATKTVLFSKKNWSSGTILRTRFWVHLVSLILGPFLFWNVLEGPKMGPFFGPHFWTPKSISFRKNWMFFIANIQRFGDQC